MTDVKSSEKEEDEPRFTLRQVKAMLAQQQLNNDFITVVKKYVEETTKTMNHPSEAIPIIGNVLVMTTIFVSTNIMMKTMMEYYEQEDK